MRPTTSTAATFALALALAAGLASCSTGGDDSGDDGGGAGGAVTVTDAWVKAADEGMTGVFGTLVNDSDRDVLVVSGSSPASDRVELHTTATGEDGQMVMTPVEDGFLVPAHGTHELAPGADHVMLMGLTGPVEPGAEVAIELVTEDGGTVELVAVARTFAGGQEEYEPADD